MASDSSQDRELPDYAARQAQKVEPMDAESAHKDRSGSDPSNLSLGRPQQPGFSGHERSLFRNPRNQDPRKLDRGQSVFESVAGVGFEREGCSLQGPARELVRDDLKKGNHLRLPGPQMTEQHLSSVRSPGSSNYGSNVNHSYSIHRPNAESVMAFNGSPHAGSDLQSPKIYVGPPRQKMRKRNPKTTEFHDCDCTSCCVCLSGKGKRSKKIQKCVGGVTFCMCCAAVVGGISMYCFGGMTGLMDDPENFEPMTFSPKEEAVQVDWKPKGITDQLKLERDMGLPENFLGSDAININVKKKA